MIKFIAIIFVLLAVGGCSRRDSVLPDKIEDGAVIARVNGESISVADVRQAYWYNAGYLEQQARLKPNGGQALAARLGKLKHELLSRMVNSRLIAQVADRQGVEADAEAVRKLAQQTVKKLGGRDNYAQYALEHGLDDQYLLKRAREELRLGLVFEQVSSTAAKVSYADATNFVKKVERYNFDVDASNRVVMARAAKVLAELSCETNFSEAASKYSEFNQHEGEDWGAFVKGELPEALEKWAFSAKIGEVAGPYEVEDGIVIVKLLAREQGVDKPSLAAEKVANVSLARICFKALMREEPFTIQEAFEFLSATRERQAREAFLKKLNAEAEIEFPMGAVPWQKIL